MVILKVWTVICAPSAILTIITRETREIFWFHSNMFLFFPLNLFIETIRRWQSLNLWNTQIRCSFCSLSVYFLKFILWSPLATHPRIPLLSTWKDGFLMYEKSAGRSEEEGSMWTQWTVTLGPLWSDNERGGLTTSYEGEAGPLCVRLFSSITCVFPGGRWRRAAPLQLNVKPVKQILTGRRFKVISYCPSLCGSECDHMIFYVCFHAKTHLIKLQLDTAEIQTVNTFRSLVTTEMEGWVEHNALWDTVLHTQSIYWIHESTSAKE